MVIITTYIFMVDWGMVYDIILVLSTLYLQFQGCPFGCLGPRDCQERWAPERSWRLAWQLRKVRGELGGFNVLHPLVNKQFAIENGHRNSGFTHWTWWFSIVMLVYQRVNWTKWWCSKQRCGWLLEAGKPIDWSWFSSVIYRSPIKLYHHFESPMYDI